MNTLRPRPGKELGRFLRFCVVGAMGAVIDFGTFNLLHAGIGISEVPSSVVSFLAAVTSNFLWNRYWTYPDSRSKTVRRQALEFAVVSLAGLAIRTPTFAVLLSPWTRLADALVTSTPALASALSADTLGANLALASAVIVVLFWNFFVNRFWTYADVDRAAPSPEAPGAESPPV